MSFKFYCKYAVTGLKTESPGEVRRLFARLVGRRPIFDVYALGGSAHGWRTNGTAAQSDTFLDSFRTLHLNN